MKHDIDFISAMVGVLGAFLKGIKKRNKMRTVIINMITGGCLALLSMDIIPYFIEDASDKTISLIAFSIGYLSSELTDNFEALLDSVFENIKNRFTK